MSGWRRSWACPFSQWLLAGRFMSVALHWTEADRRQTGGQWQAPNGNRDFLLRTSDRAPRKVRNTRVTLQGKLKHAIAGETSKA